MVTAGIYLLARLNFLFVLSPAAMTVVACIGVATALLGAVIGLFQYDIKRVLAYSTVSQLGFMFVAVGVGAWWAAVFHLVTHACFKACLFLGSGSVIHGMHELTHARHGAHDDEHAQRTGDDEHQPRVDPRLQPDPTDPQDMRNMGGLGALMPSTRRTYLVACWAIAGFPWAAGFFSKDEILAQAFGRSPLLWLAGIVAATCTSFYMFRSYYLTFEARPASDEHRRYVHESPRVMTWVLWALAGACLVVGPLFGLPALLSGREPMLARLLEPVTQLSRAWLPTAAPHRGLELGLMLASVTVAALGWIAARALYKDVTARDALLATLRSRFDRLHALAFDTFRVDELYDATIVRGVVRVARAAAWFDAHIVDGIIRALGAIARGAGLITGAIDAYLVDGAVNGVANLLLGGGRALRRVQTGRVNNYVLGVAVGVVVLIVLTSWL
jgi:NADH-quinone oxidoreductase subunit L